MMYRFFQCFTDVWRLMKKYGARLDEERWERFLADGEALLGRYRAQGRDAELLFRDLFGAVQKFYERKNDEK